MWPVATKLYPNVISQCHLIATYYVNTFSVEVDLSSLSKEIYSYPPEAIIPCLLSQNVKPNKLSGA